MNKKNTPYDNYIEKRLKNKKFRKKYLSDAKKHKGEIYGKQIIELARSRIKAMRVNREKEEQNGNV